MVDVIVKFFHLINVITAYKPTAYSKLIRSATKQKHDLIESHPFIKQIIKGTLNDGAYAAYLFNLSYIYREIEHNFYSEINSMDLIQTKRILNDIESYKNFLNLNSDVFSVSFYNDWLNHIKSKPKFFRKTDLYIRWLADMYGGQIIKRKVRFGTKYIFKDLRVKIKKIRNFIEQGLNHNNIQMFIDEINTSYDLHYKLVDQLSKYYNIENLKHQL
jgi:heme oxygenase